MSAHDEYDRMWGFYYWTHWQSAPSFSRLLIFDDHLCVLPLLGRKRVLDRRDIAGLTVKRSVLWFQAPWRLHIETRDPRRLPDFTTYDRRELEYKLSRHGWAVPTGANGNIDRL
jgi:hypothetical protein